AGRLYAELTEARAERLTPVLALGGGVIGDLAGFVAATYLRGVPLIQLPTTLLAQVDSSIGGKVAVDYGQLKNRIGAFYQPRLVITDTATLQTLPPPLLADGLAEVIKSAVIRDKELFVYLEKHLAAILALEEERLEEVVFRTARIKAAVVAADEKESGLRAILNYGHTVGHALETVSDFGLSHGAAVAIGMVVAAALAQRMGLLKAEVVTRLEKLVRGAGLPIRIPGLDPERIIKAVGYDKKVMQGRARFILPRDIGEVFISDEVSLPLLKEVLVSYNEKA
ncbi:MAG: 3-dehydroquinate synthase, partial [Chloroflexota bacterium]